MNRHAVTIYNTAIKKGLHKVFNLDKYREDEMIDLLFPIWRSAIHKIMLKRECCALSDDEASCFLHLSPAEQVGMIPPENVYSFFYFAHVITEGRVSFYNQILDGQCQDLNS